MLGRTMSCQLDGLSAGIVQIEAEILGGFSAFYIVGLAGPSIQEAKERVRAAMRASDCPLPPGKILVNLYPADERKTGTQWDLPMAMALASAMGMVDPKRCMKSAFIGELGLDGSLRPVPGAFQMVLGLVGRVDKVFMEAGQAETCAYIEGIEVYPVTSLRDLICHFQGQEKLTPCPHRDLPKEARGPISGDMDYKDIRGQAILKRIMVLAVLGRHSLLLVGPPGNGKSMALERASTILPDLEGKAIREVMGVRSIFCQGEADILSTRPPFIMPHYSISPFGLVGGGSPIRPGLITRAHRGVLVMDELPLFSSQALNALRLPLDHKKITLTRNHRSRTYPSDFLLLSAMNPCPCGYQGAEDHDCSCTIHQVRAYRGRISQALLDRFDMVCELGPAQKEEGQGKDSRTMRDEVKRGRRAIEERRRAGGWPLPVSSKGASLLDMMTGHYGLSSRSRTGLLKLAGSIAVLREGEAISEEDLAEAFQYRRARYKYWEK